MSLSTRNSFPSLSLRKGLSQFAFAHLWSMAGSPALSIFPHREEPAVHVCSHRAQRRLHMQTIELHPRRELDACTKVDRGLTMPVSAAECSAWRFAQADRKRYDDWD